MKKTIIYLIVLLFTIPAVGQMPTDGDYSDWNWEDQSQSNWKRKDGNIWVDINPPFKPETERIGKIVEVYESSDYTKSKGWQLLWAQFDGIYPYFILYSKHKGLVRAFFYLDEQPFDHVLATLSYYDISSPGILTFGDEYQVASDKYLNGTETSDDMISVIIPFVAPDNWCSADFPIMFDDEIQNVKYNSKKWVFKFYGCENYQIKLKGTVGPASMEQHTISGNSSSVTSNSFDATHAKLHKQLETNDKFMKQMQTSVKGIDTSSADFLQSYKSIVTSLKPLGEIFSAAVGISSGVGAVLGFMKIVNGTFDDQKSTTPTAVIQYIELEGSMDIEFNLGGNTLKIPGVNGSYFPPVSWEPYDCPMGYINLEKTPTIRKTTPYYKYELDGDNSGTVYVNDDGEPYKVLLYKNYPPFFVKDNQPVYSGYLGKFVKYKFEDDNVIALNDIPGLSLIDIHFALVFKLTGTGAEKFDITKKYITHIFYDDSGRELHIPVVNPVYKALDEGIFKIYKYDVDNDEIYIGTPELTINKLRDIVIEIPEKSELMLRVIGKFNSTYYDNPIIFQANYKMNESVENAKKGRLVWAWEQTNYLFSDYYSGEVSVELTGTSNSKHTAGQIVATPTFEGTAGFEANPVSIYPSRGNTQVNHYSYSCSSILKSASNTDITYNEVGDPLQSVIKIYPNPNNGHFVVSSSLEKITCITVYDAMGRAIYLDQDINSLERIINLNENTPGIYLVKIIYGDNELSLDRIIIQ